MKTLIRLLPQEQSDLGLHCLSRPICTKTDDHYCNLNSINTEIPHLDKSVLTCNELKLFEKACSCNRKNKFTGTLNHNQNKTKGQIFNSGIFKDVSKDAGIYAILNEYLYLLTFEIMLMLR